MRIIADFHIHSKYSRATSRDMDLEHLNAWAQIKGIDVLGTGDFTHPLWFKELKEKLEPAESGFFVIKNNKLNSREDFDWHLGDFNKKVRFILTSEISCIYSKNGKVRKTHILIFVPDFKTVEEINRQLGKIGNLKSDGRPILGLDAKKLAEIVLNINPNCLIIPAHAWTPWFGVFGLKSGFDSLEECFEDYTKYIYAIETGLSSDPAMNWRLSKLDNIVFISNSDCHSPSKIGREANVFNLIDSGFSYEGVKNIICGKDRKKFLYTIEFFPEEGKYYYDGHRNCGVSFKPKESKKHKNICPKCGKPLTMGVMHRVDDLADRLAGEKPKNAIPFKSLIPLEEIIADTLRLGVKSKKVQNVYKDLINNFDNEFMVLLDADCDEIKRLGFGSVAEGIKRVREGMVKIKPGYDGEYGKIEILNESEKRSFGLTKSDFL